MTHPDARLRRVAEPVIAFDEQLTEQFAVLEKQMRNGPGGVGIAAPQLALNRRMIVVDCRHSLRPCKHHGLLRMANPAILASTGESIGREGCLSVPDWVAMVPRAKKITVRYDDPQGQAQEIACSGFEARVIQHEIDHLDGILFIDRVVSKQTLVRRLASST